MNRTQTRQPGSPAGHRQPMAARAVLVLFLACLLSGIAVTAVAAGPKAESPRIDPLQGELFVQAREAAKMLALRLRVALKETLATHGPAEAVAACNQAAPQLTRELSLEKGWKMTRVSLKPRNALLGTPDAWEQKVLLDFERRRAAGEDPGTLETSMIVNEPQGTFFRYMKAIPTEPTCVICHGPRAGISTEIQGFLDRYYPHDLAVGFAPGDLRGAVSIKARTGER